MRRPEVILAALLAALLGFGLSPSAVKTERYLVRITAPPAKMASLFRRPLDFASQAVRERPEAVVTHKEMEALIRDGYHIEILQSESDLAGVALDPFYHVLEETQEFLRTVERSYPQIAKLHIIGRSTLWRVPLLALKISDHPDEDEDEPAVLFDGMHHAREPLGNEICLALIDHLVSRYGWDERVTSWVNDYEIWVIPIMNPEGYKYITDNALASPWWRKNLRDNDGNGQIDLDYDGVDLNRNYDWNWIYAGSSNPADWTYRGPQAFSEDETRAKRDLALRERFVLSLTYHSTGEIVYYQWSWPGTSVRAPDHALLQEIAAGLAGRIKNTLGTGTYDYGRQTGASQSSPWMYAVTGALEFLVETGTSFIPLDIPLIESIVASNLEGAFFMLDRGRGPGITGRVLDGRTGEPVEATVSIVEIDDFRYILPRKSDPATGRYTRLLRPGKYTLEIRHPFYASPRFSVDVGSHLKTKDIILLPRSDRRSGRDRGPRKD